MKLISYSLFNSPVDTAERNAYIRGFYFNCRMNNLIYPDWRTHLEVEAAVYFQFKNLFDWLVENNNLHLTINDYNPPLCVGMIWRMKPIWSADVTHILCRDSDALTTYREALSVQEWIESGYAVHALHDNPAHGGLMGGMIGINTSKFKALTGFDSFEQMIDGYDLSKRGSDQNLLNQRILPKVQNDVIFRGGSGVSHLLHPINFQGNLPGVEQKYWTSNLCTAFIGSAGFNELETIRFLRDTDIYNWKYISIEKEFAQLFHWHLQ
jgi:hypothetical protein